MCCKMIFVFNFRILFVHRHFLRLVKFSCHNNIVVAYDYSRYKLKKDFFISNKIYCVLSSEWTENSEIIISGFPRPDASRYWRCVLESMHVCECISTHLPASKNELHSLRIFVFFFFGVFDLKILLECGWRMRFELSSLFHENIHETESFGSKPAASSIELRVANKIFKRNHKRFDKRSKKSWNAIWWKISGLDKETRYASRQSRYRTTSM